MTELGRFHSSALPIPAGVLDGTVGRLLVFPIGEPPSNDGRKWRFTQDDLGKVVESFQKRTEPLPVLFAHGEDRARGGEAAGWIDALSLEGDGIWATVRWTGEARDAVRAGKWGFRSPGFDGWTDAEGFIHPTSLAEVSLVNDPAIGAMLPIAARKQEETQVTELAAKKNAGATTFDASGILAALRAAFKLPEAVSDEMLTTMAATALAGGSSEAPEEPMPEMPAEVAPDPAVPAAIQPAQASALRILPTETVEDVKADLAKNARVIAAVQKSATLKRIKPEQLDMAGRLAIADVEAYEAVLCAPVPPPAGRVVNITASDRGGKPLTFADQVREQRFAAMRDKR